MITMESVSKSYSTGVPALNDVSLHIKKDGLQVETIPIAIRRCVPYITTDGRDE